MVCKEELIRKIELASSRLVDTAARLVETANSLVDYAKAEREVYPFVDDEEKMVDFFTLPKEQFLQSYSYLTEAEYDKTLQTCMALKRAARASRTKLTKNRKQREHSL